jgi:hypothetical protein
MFLYIYHYPITKTYNMHIYLFKIHDYYGFLINYYDFFIIHQLPTNTWEFLRMGQK